MIGVITNPRAGKNLEDPGRIARLRHILGPKGILRDTRDRMEISDAAREFRRLGIDMLVIDGGDGTIHHTLSTFIPLYGETDLPPVALLRGGTMNNIARSLGIKGLSEEILRGILNDLKARVLLEVVRTNTIVVNDRHGFIFGLGFPVNLLEAYYRGKGRGAGKVVKVLLEILYSTLQGGGGSSPFFRAIAATIQIEGEVLSNRRYTAILSSTVREVGLGFKPTRRAGQEEGFFQILCCDMGPRRMGLTVLRMILAMESRDPKLVDRMVTQCTIHLESPTDMQIDGEIFRSQEEIRLHIGPAIQFIRMKVPLQNPEPSQHGTPVGS